MDDRTAEVIADLYESKLFDATSIGGRFGIPRQRVVAISDRVRHERMVVRVKSDRHLRGLFQKIPDRHLRGNS